MERLIVGVHIFSAIPPNYINDQYGFKPTGCTTAVLVDLTNRISVLLEDIKYVRSLLIDFTKALDSVDHRTLIVKLKKLKIADTVDGCISNR